MAVNYYTESTDRFLNEMHEIKDPEFKKLIESGGATTAMLGHMALLMAGIADELCRVADALEGGKHEDPGHQDPGGDESGHIGTIHGGLPESDQA